MSTVIEEGFTYNQKFTLQFGTADYFFDNKMDFTQQINTFPLSARKLSRKQRFNPRGSFVTHLITQQTRETNDLLCQANRWEDIYRPTSEQFTPSVERETQFLDISQHEETITMASAPRSQPHLSPTPTIPNQGTSTPLAPSNRQPSPSLFGSALSPSSQNSQTFDDQEFIVEQLDQQ